MRNYPRLRLATLARLINERVPGVQAEVHKTSVSTDRKIAGTRLRHPGKGRTGNRLLVWERGKKHPFLGGTAIIDHNSAETYRTNDDVFFEIERRWGRIWESV